MSEFDNPERRIVIQGTPSEEQIRKLYEFAGGLGLRMVVFNKRDNSSEPTAEGTVEPLESTTVGVGLEAAEDQDVINQLTTSETESRPFRKTGSKFSFQKFGFDTYVDQEADQHTQRAQKGKISSIWGALARGRFIGRTKNAQRSLLIGTAFPLDYTQLKTQQLLGVDLPDYSSVPEVTETYKSYGFRPSPYDGETYTYVESENCDDIDIDGLAKYVVAAAGRVNDIHETMSIRSKQTHAILKKFIPDGVGMPSLLILAEYCKHMLANDSESPVSQVEIQNAIEIFTRIIKK